MSQACADSSNDVLHLTVAHLLISIILGIKKCLLTLLLKVDPY